MNLPFKNLKDSKPPNGSEIWFIDPNRIFEWDGFELAEVSYIWLCSEGENLPYEGPEIPEPYEDRAGRHPYKLCYEIAESIFEGHEDLWWIGAEELDSILKECSFDSDPYLQTR
jgi:hypothetical protein